MFSVHSVCFSAVLVNFIFGQCKPDGYLCWDRTNHFALHGCCNIFMLYCAVLNHLPGIGCGILNSFVQSLFLLDLCSHCPGLAPKFTPV